MEDDPVKSRLIKGIAARKALKSIGVPIGADFHTLSSHQVSALLDLAREVRYRKPRDYPGSKARAYHDRLQRQARSFSYSWFGPEGLAGELNSLRDEFYSLR